MSQKGFRNDHSTRELEQMSRNRWADFERSQSSYSSSQTRSVSADRSSIRSSKYSDSGSSSKAKDSSINRNPSKVPLSNQRFFDRLHHESYLQQDRQNQRMKRVEEDRRNEIDSSSFKYVL